MVEALVILINFMQVLLHDLIEIGRALNKQLLKGLEIRIFMQMGSLHNSVVNFIILKTTYPISKSHICSGNFGVFQSLCKFFLLH